MRKIKNIIQSYYLAPEKFIYQTISKLNKYFTKIVLILSIMLLALPIIQAVNLVQQLSKLENDLEKTMENVMKKENILKAKIIEKGNNTSFTPTKINQALETLFQQQQVEINHIQWELEQDKQINITITQKAQALFEIIHQINQIEYLRIKEMTLTKLDYQQLVQLNAILQLVK